MAFMHVSTTDHPHCSVLQFVQCTGFSLRTKDGWQWGRWCQRHHSLSPCPDSCWVCLSVSTPPGMFKHKPVASLWSATGIHQSQGANSSHLMVQPGENAPWCSSIMLTVALQGQGALTRSKQTGAGNQVNFPKRLQTHIRSSSCRNCSCWHTKSAATHPRTASAWFRAGDKPLFPFLQDSGNEGTWRTAASVGMPSLWCHQIL